MPSWSVALHNAYLQWNCTPGSSRFPKIMLRVLKITLRANLNKFHRVGSTVLPWNVYAWKFFHKKVPFVFIVLRHISEVKRILRERGGESSYNSIAEREFAGGLFSQKRVCWRSWPSPARTYVNNATRKPTSGNEMIFVQINLCEIENPAHVYITSEFRAYKARGWEASRERCARASSRNTLCVISKYVVRREKTYNFHSRLYNIFDNTLFLYKSARKNYIKIVRRTRNSPQRCGRRVANPISIKTDGSILFKREWFVCNLQWHNTVSAESRYATLCICCAYI